ncbi:MAG: sterol desaturase family protein [Blastocatellia bacterium]|nr:sterol desaturase family protein [Blastocatellia bacterium]
MLSLLYTPFCFLSYILVEKFIPGWKLPQVSGWATRIAILTGCQTVLTVALGFLWEVSLNKGSMLDLGCYVHPLTGGALAYIVSTFVYYWWHRARHQSAFLWRVLHQLHHSPRRMEVLTALYRHPLEVVLNAVIGSFLVYTVFGLPPEAPVYYGLFTAAGQFFVHLNVRTPRWVGYVFQRPEMHRLHHAYGYHASNFGEIVWWDMLFGTYVNPAEAPVRCGFEAGQEEQFWGMLLGEDVQASPGAGMRRQFSTQIRKAGNRTRNSPGLGFSLVELLILLLIVLMLAAIAVPCVVSARYSANTAAAQQTLRNLHTAETSFALTLGRGSYTADLTKLGGTDRNNLGLLDQSVVQAQRVPKNGYLLSPIRTVTLVSDNQNKMFRPAAYSLRNMPVASSGLTRTGNDGFFLDESGVIRHSHDPKVWPDAQSEPVQ